MLRFSEEEDCNPLSAGFGPGACGGFVAAVKSSRLSSHGFFQLGIASYVLSSHLWVEWRLLCFRCFEGVLFNVHTGHQGHYKRLGFVISELAMVL